MFEQLGKSSHSAAQSLHVKSALNPMLWLTAMVMPISFTAAYFFKDSGFIFELLIFVGVAPVVFTCLGFAYFAVFKTEKLQSEDYQLRSQSLQIIQQKIGTIEMPIASLENIANPRNYEQSKSEEI